MEPAKGFDAGWGSGKKDIWAELFKRHCWPYVPGVPTFDAVHEVSIPLWEEMRDADG